MPALVRATILLGISLTKSLEAGRAKAQLKLSGASKVRAACGGVTHVVLCSTQSLTTLSLSRSQGFKRRSRSYRERVRPPVMSSTCLLAAQEQVGPRRTIVVLVSPPASS